MSQVLTYKTNILDALSGILGSFNLVSAVWDTYEKHAVSRIEEAILKLRGAQYYVKDLSSSEANKELEQLMPIVATLADLRTKIKDIDRKEFKRFKIKALEFCEAVAELYEDIQEVAGKDLPYQISQSVLEVDWNQPEDDHWDNY